jgi:electron transport complex protein RnfG
MSDSKHPIIRSSVLLGIIALLGTVLLAGVNELTHERIIEQEKRRVLQQLNEIVPTALYNNDLLADKIEINEQDFFRHSAAVTVYRARMNDQPVAVMMIVTAPDGYNGDIRVLVGIAADGTVFGVRVISHRETPGLGDPIAFEKSDWVLGFKNTSLRNPESDGWAVKKDGGQFDQFTGATISPRAVVKVVHRALVFFEANRQMLFDTPTETEKLRVLQNE